MRPEALLVADPTRNAQHYFSAIDGRKAENSTKAALLHEHLKHYDINPATTVLIGDSPNAAHAAHTAGARSILVATGTTSRARLDTAGAPVVDTIADTLQLTGIAATQPQYRQAGDREDQ